MNTLESCKKYTRDNIIICSREILSWHNTGILENGKVRELARMVSE